MPNHFHFALHVKDEKELAELWMDKIAKKKIKLKLKLAEKESPATETSLIVEDLVNEQFSHFFNSYVQSYNKSYNRMGALMKQSFQRKKIEGDDHLCQVICYIHSNPVQDGFA